MSTTPTSFSTSAETGLWFTSDGVLHRCNPGVSFLFKLNTIDGDLTPHGGDGFFHSSLLVERTQEITEREVREVCDTCFPEGATA